MGVKLSDRQNQALAILAIATAAIGFGLLGADWELQSPDKQSAGISLIYVTQLTAVLGAIVSYFAVLWDTAKALRREDTVTGLELVHGPMLSMAGEMICLAGLFLIRALL